MLREEIYLLVDAERDHQDNKWGSFQNHSFVEWMAILGEEYGELCQEVLRSHFGGVANKKELVSEAIQVMAVCAAILEGDFNV